MRWRSAEHYRQRAQELRDAAEHMTDETARENLKDLARQYDDMAKRAPARTEKELPNSPPRARE